MTDRAVIETAGLTKRYDDVDALRGLDLRVPRGSIFGFLGRNGAGKTTTIKILLGMVHPTGGRVHVFDVPAAEHEASVAITRRCGFGSEEKDLYNAMTVGEIVAFTASFYPRWRAYLQERYLRSFELSADANVKTLSRGTRTKLALLLAFCRGAELLVLDEPTSGLDPAMTEEVLQILVRHVAEGETTVFFSSHQIAEVDQIADHVAIVDRGRRVVAGALDDLRDQYRRVQMVFEHAVPDLPAAMTDAAGVRRISRDGRVLTVLSSTGGDAVVQAARSLN